ncbi:hypothetical protein ACFU76_36715 [Streptomyces sp. NPDC057539]|uniref:hypothetical protein n=1 Tax=Streptomyces sp. NPDC057539 TaxID=3346159 RepID=UPI00368CE452
MAQEKENGKGADGSEIEVLKKSWDTFYEDMVKKEYFKQFELSGVKTEANAAVAAANVFNAELTGIKFEHTFWDPIAEREQRLLESGEKLPWQLRRDINDARSDLNVARRDIDRGREVTNRAHVRITDLVRDMNRKLGLKADKTAMRNTDAQRTPQIQHARRTADEASASIDLLTRRLRDLGIAI